MDWWQILLIILVSIIIGLGVGYLVGYLIVTRILKKPFVAFSIRPREAVAVSGEPQKSTTTPGLFTKLTKIHETTGLQAEERAKIETQEVIKEATVTEEAPKPAVPDLVAELAQERDREKAAVAEERLKIAAPDLLAEVENNWMIANEPWTGKLVPFQTYVWNSSPAKLHTLPADLREHLAQAYSDIQLANSIVWLATELGRRSPNLDENYMKLCTNIAARLQMIMPFLKESGNK